MQRVLGNKIIFVALNYQSTCHVGMKDASKFKVSWFGSSPNIDYRNFPYKFLSILN